MTKRQTNIITTPIKFVEANKQAIEDALKEANPTESPHAFCTYSELQAEVIQAEKWMQQKLEIPKYMHKGVLLAIQSGKKASFEKKFNTKVMGTAVLLKRNPTHWVLLDAKPKRLNTYTRNFAFFLTAEQDAEAIHKYRRRTYFLAREASDTENSIERVETLDSVSYCTNNGGYIFC